MTLHQTEWLLGPLALLSSLSSSILKISSITPEVAALLISSGYLSFKGGHLDKRDNKKAEPRREGTSKDSREFTRGRWWVVLRCYASICCACGLAGVLYDMLLATAVSTLSLGLTMIRWHETGMGVTAKHCECLRHKMGGGWGNVRIRRMWW